MRTIIYCLITFILLTALIQSSNHNSVNNVSENKITKISKIDSLLNLPCCNTGKPSNCNPSYKMGLYKQCGEIEITCECCIEIYEYYGNPQNLYNINIPCNLVGYRVCVPTKTED
jgi:hypothetical protein